MQCTYSVSILLIKKCYICQNLCLIKLCYIKGLFWSAICNMYWMYWLWKVINLKIWIMKCSYFIGNNVFYFCLMVFYSANIYDNIRIFLSYSFIFCIIQQYVLMLCWFKFKKISYKYKFFRRLVKTFEYLQFLQLCFDYLLI